MADDREYLDWLPLFPEQTEDDVLGRMIDWANEGLTPASDHWVDTREGSLWRTAVIPGVREIVRLIDMLGVDVPASVSPLRAWGPYLDELAEVVDVIRLAATPASGVVRFRGPAATVIAGGTQVGVAPVSEEAPAPIFAVTVGGTIPAALTTPTGVGATPSGSGGLMAGGTYYYKVSALNAFGETLASAEASAVVPGGGTGSVSVSWTNVAGATSYRIYRGTAPGAQAVYYTDAGTPFVDTGAANTAGTVPTANTTTAIDLNVTAVDAGAESNVSAFAIVELLTPLAGVTVSNALPTSGGSDPETDLSLRTKLLEAYRGQGAGNPGDYRRWARTQDGVGRATVIPTWDGPGTVKVIITDADGQPVSAGIVAAVQAFFDPVTAGAEGYAPIGIAVTVETPTLLDIAITADIEPEPGYSLTGGTGLTALADALRAAVDAYLRTVETGEEVVRAQVARALAAVTGVHDVAAVTLSGAAGNGNVLVPVTPPQVPVATVQTYTEVAL